MLDPRYFGLEVRFSYRGSDVVETLERIAVQNGRPKRVRVDQGPEFFSTDLDLWNYQHDVVLDFSLPGKPTHNAFAESSTAAFGRNASTPTGF